MSIKTAEEYVSETWDKPGFWQPKNRNDMIVMLDMAFKDGQKEIIEAVMPVLGFYADEKSYRSKYGGHIENKNFRSGIGQDCGKRARESKVELDEILKEVLV